MSTLPFLVSLFVAGGLGTLSRYGLNQLALWVVPNEFPVFPYGTSLINALGCLLFGVALGMVHEKVIPASYAPVVLVGFLGAFTTFSTFAAESFDMLQGGKWTGLVVYVAIQNVVGVLCLGVGLRLVE
jgi:fluoride exporter